MPIFLHSLVTLCLFLPSVVPSQPTPLNGTAYPNLSGLSPADLTFSFKINFPLYSGTEFAFTLTDCLFLKTTRCWLSAVDPIKGLNVTAEDCVLPIAGGKEAKLRIDTGGPIPIDNNVELSLSLGSAVTVPNATSLLLSMTVSFCEETLATYAVNFTLTQSQKVNFTSANISITGTDSQVMQYSYSELVLTFTLDTVLNEKSKIWLQFPSSFDPFLGNVVFDQSGPTLDCEPSFSADTACSVFAQGVYARVTKAKTKNTLLSLTVKDLRIPKDLGQAEVRLIDEYDSILGVRTVDIPLNTKGLDLKCCYSFDKTVLENCSGVDKGVCKAFGSNTGQYTADMNIIRFQFRQSMKIDRLAHCENYFAESTLAMMGTDPLCFWRNPVTLLLYFGANPTFRSQIASFGEGKLALYDNHNVTLPRLDVWVSYPLILISPEPIISGPNIVSENMKANLSCELTRNTGRRLFDCFWSIDNNAQPQASSSLLLSSSNCLPSCTIDLDVINFFQMKNRTSIKVFYIANQQMAVSLTPSDRSKFNRSDTVVFSAVVAQGDTTTSQKDQDLTYVWSLNNGDKLDCGSQRSCAVALKSLAGEIQEYTLNLNVTKNGLNGFVSKTFSVVPTPIVLVVRRPIGKVSSDTSVELDASRSYDPDLPKGANLIGTWTWKCSNSSGREYPYNSTGDNSIANFGTLPPDIYEVGVTFVAQGKNATEMIPITVISGFTPTIRIDPPKIINPSETNVISANVSEGCSVNWVLQDLNETTATLSPRSGLSLMIAPNTLDFGSTYNFGLSVTCGSITSIATISMYVNSPPLGGIFQVTPNTGTELTDTFVLQAKSWIDLEGNYPLSYQYLRQTADGHTEAISATMAEFTLSTMLALKGGQSFVVLLCNVYDSLHANFTNRFNVILLPLEVPSKPLEFLHARAAGASASAAENPGNLLVFATSIVDFSRNHNDLPSNEKMLSRGQLLNLTNSIVDLVQTSLTLSSSNSSHDFTAIAEVIGYLAADPDLVSPESLQKSVDVLADIGSHVASVERDQGRKVLSTLSTLANVSSLSTSESISKSLNQIAAVTDMMSDLLLNVSIPGANPILINTDNITVNLFRTKLGSYQASPDEIRQVPSRTNNTAVVSVSFKNITQLGKPNQVLDIKVAAYSFLPHSDSVARMLPRNVYLCYLNFSTPAEVTERCDLFHTDFKYSNVSKTDAVTTNISTIGVVDEMGGVDTRGVSESFSPLINISYPISTPSDIGRSMCVSYDIAAGEYSNSACDTYSNNSTSIVHCSCKISTIVALIEIPDKITKAMSNTRLSALTQWTPKLTRWSVALLTSLIVLMLFSVSVAHAVDKKSVSDINTLYSQLKSINDRVFGTLLITIPADHEIHMYASAGDSANFFALQAQIDHICFRLTHWRPGTEVKMYANIARKVRDYVMSNEMNEAFKFEERMLLRSMRKLISRRINVAKLLSELKDGHKEVSISDINLEVMKEDYFLPFEDKLINSFYGDVSDGAVLIDERNIATQRSESQSLTKAFYSQFPSMHLEKKISVFHVYDVMPIDHWWQMMVEKDLILSVLFYTKRQVTRVTRVILLWDFILIQLVMLGIFLNNLNTFGSDNLVTILDVWKEYRNQNYWKYLVYSYGLSFIWTSTLELLSEVSPLSFFTDEVKLLPRIIQWVSWLLSIGTILICLVFSFFFVNIYEEDPPKLIHWMIVFAISLLKDIVLGFHAKGLAFVLWRKVKKMLFR